MSKILVTAFEPFGLIGAWLRRSNASMETLEHLKQGGDEHIMGLVLPASDAGMAQFKETLDRVRPAGVISMGEHMLIPSTNVVVEPHAYDMGVTAMPLRHLFSDKVEAPFVKRHEEQSGSSMIGGYYCNQIYLQGLQWAQENGNVPVAFVHVPVIGSAEKSADQVQNLIQKMKSEIEHASAPEV